MSNFTTLRQLGRTGLMVSSISVGAAGWQLRPSIGGPTVDETLALGKCVLAHPWINCLDTSNNYGAGQSERRVGLLLDIADGIPPGFIISTKADRHGQTGDFSGSRMRRSLEESLARLGLDVLPMVFLHDPENTTWTNAISADGPIAALVQARDEGLIDHLGISGGNCEMLSAFIDLGVFEAVITHNRFTLVDRSAESLLSNAHAAGIGVFNAAPYGGGILTSYPLPSSRYAYQPAHPELVRAAAEMGRIATKHGVNPAAVALQFSLRDPRITSTIVGMRTVADLRATEELAQAVVPPELWDAVNAVQLATESWQDQIIPWSRR